MKKPNKFIQFCFLISALQSALFIVFFVGIIPTVALSRKVGNEIFEIIGSETFRPIFNGLTFFSFINWIFCLRFWYKNDKYSKAILALLFPNVIYAPFYYYQVIIKKRPLINNINSIEINIQSNEFSIDQNDFIELTRNDIINIIDLLTQNSKQLEYQKNIPVALLSSELYCQWNESYAPKSEDFRQAFNEVELNLLAEFDKELNIISKKIQSNILETNNLVDAIELKTFYNLAKDILSNIKHNR